MAMYALGRAQPFIVVNDFDVVILRQEVRQRARQLGMDLRMQARLTAVISSVAREFLAINCTLHVTLARAGSPHGDGIDMVCAAAAGHNAPNAAHLEHILDDVRPLVNEVILGGEPGTPVVILRVIR